MKMQMGREKKEEFRRTIPGYKNRIIDCRHIH